MGDYPDYTTLTQIIGTDVTIPIEIKAITVAHIDVDLVAQTIGNIAVNIAASAVTLSVAIASSAVTLNVNITSITGGVTFNIGTVTGTVNVAIASSAVTLNVNISSITGVVTFNIGTVSGTVQVNIKSITGGVTFNIGTVSGTVQVNIASTTGNISVNIAASAVTLNVTVTNASIAVTGTVSITGTPSVTISGTPTVTISGTVTVSVTGTASISIIAQTVGVYLQPDWQVKAGTDKNLAGLVSTAAGATSTVIDYTVTTGKKFYICEWGFNVATDIGVWAVLFSVHDSTITYLAHSGGRVGNSHSLSKPIVVVAGDHIKVNVANFDTSSQNLRAHVGGYEI